jgi:microcystin-dependent protein
LSACNSATSCAERFRTFELESNFLRSNAPNNPAPGSDIVFQQRAADVNFGGTGVINYIANVLDEGLNLVVANAGHVDVLSAISSASGDQVTLVGPQLPRHDHFMRVVPETTQASPSGCVGLGNAPIYATPLHNDGVSMADGAIGAAGGGQPHDNRQAYLALSFIIALEGMYPSRS